MLSCSSFCGALILENFTMEPVEQMRSYNTAMLVFLIGGVCVGVPALLYSTWRAYVCRRNGGRLSIFLVFLFLTDFLYSVFTVPVAIFLPEFSITPFSISKVIVIIIHKGLHYSGLYFHQLVALESVLFSRFPLFASHVFSRACSIMLSLFVLIQVAMTLSSPWSVSDSSLILPPVAVLIVTLVLRGAAVSEQQDSDGQKKARLRVCIVSVIAMMLFVPLILAVYVMLLMMHNNHDIEEILYSSHKVMCMTLAVTFLRLIPDALLCVFVCRSYQPGHTPKPYTELSTNPESTIITS